jgi:peptidyl-dipeptidase A
MPTAVSDLLAGLEARLRPLELELSRAWWEANVESSDATEAHRQEVELRLRSALADREAFAAVARALRDGNGATALERRQLERLRAQMLPNQLDDDVRARLVELETRVEKLFNVHRGEIDGERVDDNRIAEILTTSDDGELRRHAWEASKSVGAEVAGLVRELVALRNQAAASLGFRDHYAMALALDELDEDRLVATLDEVERLTEAPFRAWKKGLDADRAERFGVGVDDLRPWHYDDPFFQEAPPLTGVDLDAHLADADLEALTMRTYDGLGIDLRPVLAGSDLYGRDAKCQHAFCIDVDRQGDVRVLCNIVANERWMETMLHEFGHAAYDRSIAPDLPWVLHAPAHMLATEAVAMLLGRLGRDPEWLATVAGLAEAHHDDVRAALADGGRSRSLVFARWALVMCHFERGLYRDPGDDHDGRWWELVERFQLVHRPDGRSAPDWAAKIHLAVAPVYYQNYLYGELVASQLQAALRRHAGGIVDRPEAGRWLVERVFRPGASRRWDELVAAATGEPLTASHFAAEL